MSNLTKYHQNKPETRTGLLTCLVRPIVTATVATVFVGVIADKALADPPPLPIPDVYCFRITDIGTVAGDMEGDAFQIEFEVLNWTNMSATDVDIALNVGSDVFFDAAFVDANGRPLGVGDSPPPGNMNTANDWSVVNQTTTYTRWDAGTSIPNRDLVGAFNSGGGNNVTAACTLIPGCTGNGIIADPETIDNGENVLDGFVLQVDQWDPGEILSFNWFLTNGGIPIGTSAGGNSYGFGTVNIARVDGVGMPSAVFTGNTGFRQTAVEFANGEFISPGEFEFAMEMGGGITAQFRNQNDSDTICGPGGCTVNVNAVNAEQGAPEPTSTLLASGLALGVGGFLKRKFSRKGKKSSRRG